MRVLYDDKKEIGEILDWTVVEAPAESKTVLGKTFHVTRPTQQCSFVSPKPVNRKSKLRVIVDRKTELVLTNIKVKAGTEVSATITETPPLTRK